MLRLLFTTSAFPEGWVTPGLGRYDRSTHTLKLPTGLEYVFGRTVTINATIGEARYVTQIRDPFNNQITFDYFDSNGPPDGIAQIHQILSGTQVRTVTFTYDPVLKSLKTMQYGDRVWTYDQDPAGPAGYSVLRVVHPEKGLPWQYPDSGCVSLRSQPFAS